jgi:hypothetical protein
MPLHLASTRDLNLLCESYEERDGQMVHLNTSFAAYDDADTGYFGKLNISKFKITLEQFQQALQPISDEEIYPLMPSDLTAASNDKNADRIYVKRPKLSWYDDVEPGGGFLPRLLLEEAYTLEFLTQHPHPNIVRYHGCLVRRGRITGLVIT